MSIVSLVSGLRLRLFAGLFLAGIATLACFSTGAALGAEVNAGTPSVALFEAVERGDVTAKVVMRSAYVGRVMLRNTTSQPVSVELPAVFAAQPVLAQVGFNNNQNSSIFNTNNSNSQQSSQAVAGPFSFTSNQSSNQNQGNNVFNIPPESMREIRIQSVCIEHGKPNPKTTIAYELVPFEQVSNDGALAAVLERYGRGDLDRDVVQAAAWHLANEKSWEELARMSKTIAVNAKEPIFTAQQIYAARRLTESAEKFVADREATSPVSRDAKPTGTPVGAAERAL